MEKKFEDWYEANEKRFAHGQFTDKDIAYSAWLEGKEIDKNINIFPHTMDTEGFKIDFIPSYTIQKGNAKLLIHPEDMPSNETFIEQNKK